MAGSHSARSSRDPARIEALVRERGYAVALRELDDDAIKSMFAPLIRDAIGAFGADVDYFIRMVKSARQVAERRAEAAARRATG